MIRTPWLEMAAVSWVMACSCAGASAAEEAETSPETVAAESRRQAIEVLLTGHPEERLEVAGDLPRLLHLPASSEADPAPALQNLGDDLIVVLRQETDDWIARTLLESLLWNDCPPFQRLFLAALESRSVNLQAMGARQSLYLDDVESMTAIEALWKHEIPSLLRPPFNAARLQNRHPRGGSRRDPC